MRRLRFLLASGTVAASLGASVACSSILGIDDGELPDLEAGVDGRADGADAGADATRTSAPDSSGDAAPGDAAVTTTLDDAGTPQTLTGSPGDLFGATVALSSDGRWLAVGAPGNGDLVFGSSTVRKGAVHLYERGDAGYTEITRTLLPQDFQLGLGGGFGQTLAFSLDGTLLAVGAPHANYPGSVDVGAVFVYGLVSGSDWETYTSTAPGLPSGSHFGSALAFGNPVAAPTYNAQLYVGVPGASPAAVYSYAYDYGDASTGHFWGQIDSHGDAGDLFGARLAATADSTVFVGAPGTVSAGGGLGASFVLQMGGTRAIDSGALLTNPPVTPSPIDLTGSTAANAVGTTLAVSADGTRLVVAAGGQSVNQATAPLGEVFPFTGGGEGGVKALPPLSGGQSATYGFGTALAVTSGALAVGDPYATVNALTGAGVVYLLAGDFGASPLVTLLASPPMASAYFGCSVAYSADGKVLAVGASATATTAGVVYLYSN